jgi:hypothetical protein
MVVPGLKARYIDVYLPSEEAKHEWEDEAKKLGITLSKFVFAAVEALDPQEMRLPGRISSENLQKPKKRLKDFAAS